MVCTRTGAGYIHNLETYLLKLQELDSNSGKGNLLKYTGTLTAVSHNEAQGCIVLVLFVPGRLVPPLGSYPDHNSSGLGRKPYTVKSH